MSSDIHLHLKRINLLLTKSDNILIISDRPDRAKHQTHRKVGKFRPHENMICIVLFVCTVLLPPGVNPIAPNKYIISYHIISFISNKIRQQSHNTRFSTIPLSIRHLGMENFPVLLTTGGHWGFKIAKSDCYLHHVCLSARPSARKEQLGSN